MRVSLAVQHERFWSKTDGESPRVLLGRGVRVRTPYEQHVMRLEIVVGHLAIGRDRHRHVRPAARDLTLEDLGGLALGGGFLHRPVDDERPLRLELERVDRPEAFGGGVVG